MELIVRLVRLGQLGQFSLKSFFRWPPGPYHSTAMLEPSIAGLFPTTAQPAYEDKKSEGFLWGVPKRRRSVEARWSRKIGAQNWCWKMFIPKTNLLTCTTCGHHYEAKHLCRNCYDKVMTETKEIRDSVEAQLGHSPEDRNIVVLYGSEKDTVDPTVTEGNILVEIEKPRPQWFSKNLLQKSTVGPDGTTTTVTVPPPNLG